MWNNDSQDHLSLQIKGLDNLNPFKKKKKKEKFSIRLVDKSKNKKKSKKNTTKSKGVSRSKPKSKSKPKPKSKSSHKKSTKPKQNHTSKSKHKTKSKPKSGINTQHTISPHIAKEKSNQNHSYQRQTRTSATKPPKQPCPTPPKPISNAYEPQHTHTHTHSNDSTHSNHFVQKPKYNGNTQKISPTQNSKPMRNKPKQSKKISNNTRHVQSHSSYKSHERQPKPHAQTRSHSIEKKSTPTRSANKKPIKTKQSKRISKKSQSQSRSRSQKKTSKKSSNERKNESDSESETDNDSENENKKNKKNKKKNRQNQQDSEFISRLESDIIDESPDISFRDVQGLAAVKLALYETIILPSLRPELFTGLRSPTNGLLLFGPPGNGKTMIAKCVASECEGTFFSISASSITSKYVGDAERIMRILFDLARDKAPSIIFIDEIDSLLTTRGGANEAESSRRIKTEFLIQFDGVKKASDSDKRVLVIGATNLPDQLDEAVLRRFGKRIMVPLPDNDTRYGLLKLLMAKQKSNLNDNDFNNVVEKTNGYSCSDLSILCKDASMGPIRDLGANIINITNESDMPFIEVKHFNLALDNVKPSLPEKSLQYFIQWNDKFGSKIHLSLNALPDNMKPYTNDELNEMI